MEQHAFKLFNLYAQWPTVLTIVYAMTLFLPLRASRYLASIIGLAIVWGLWVHRAENLEWWQSKWVDSRFIPDLSAPEGLEYLMREAFVYGFYSCFCACLAVLLFVTPIFARSHVRSSLMSYVKARSSSSNNSLSSL